MDARELDLTKKLETEILSRELSPAEPVGLRCDRLAREGWLSEPRSSASRRSLACVYWSCNREAVAALLKGRRNVLVACEESWAEELPLTGTRAVKGASVGPFDAVLADSSILLSGELTESLSSFRRVLGAGGRVVLLVANWEYEMEGESVSYDLSFRCYRGNVHAGLVKRTLEPALEVEYVCVLDPDEPIVMKLAELPREKLRRFGVRDVPGLGRLVVSAEVIKLPQATVRSLETAGREAGFSRSVIAGAPGILASAMCSALPLSGACQPRGDASPGSASERLETSSGPADDVHQALALSFPFVPAAGSPHLLAVFLA